jgi:meso-butanediol dehydrogenase / (S,S)-butanediol dehydrogenase / diacetyl reductase
MRFRGKKVLVTGSTAGIGRGAVEAFRAEGAMVAINGRDSATVDRTMADLSGDRLVAAPGDLSTVDGCRQIVDKAVAALGGLDILVNNAGLSLRARLMDVTEEIWDDVMAVNLRAPFFCTKFALPALRASKGNVVMVSSISGLLAGPTDRLVYAISKGGLAHLSPGLAQELASDNVRINSVCPGYTSTSSMEAKNAASGGAVSAVVQRCVPLGRIGTVPECVSAILYAASPDASYMTGSVIVNDGGCVATASWGGANITPSPSGAKFVPNNVTR